MYVHTFVRGALLSVTLCLPSLLFSCVGFDNDDLISMPATADRVLCMPNTQETSVWQWIKDHKLLFEKRDRNVAQMAKDMFLADDPYEKPRKKVRANILDNYGAEQLLVRTRDNEVLSSLLFHRPNAPVNIIYVTGYFGQQTPTAEWGAPFSVIFPECNVLLFDWRGYGESSGSFSFDAKNDITAMIELCRTDERLADIPTVVVGFCIGAAITAEALADEQEKEDGILPDAFSASCMLADMKDLHTSKRIRSLASNAAMSGAAAVPFIRKFLLNRMLDKKIQKLKPAKTLSKLRLPCALEYAAGDKFAPLGDGKICYDALTSAPLRHFIVSEPAGHARLHPKTPIQYRDAYIDFFYKAGLITSLQAHEMHERSLMGEEYSRVKTLDTVTTPH